MRMNFFYVITGGPGAGKTALVNGLKSRGFRCVDEHARQIIIDEVNAGGDALPWKNLDRFKELMLHLEIKSYNLASDDTQEITFFDRGIPDLIAYDRRTGKKSSYDLENAARTLLYNRRVFIVPPWEAIYCSDSERKQTFEEAVDVYEAIREVYVDYGYDLVEVPKAGVEDRVKFIIRNL